MLDGSGFRSFLGLVKCIFGSERVEYAAASFFGGVGGWWGGVGVGELPPYLYQYLYSPVHEPDCKKVTWNIRQTCQEKVEIETATQNTSAQRHSIVHQRVGKPGKTNVSQTTPTNNKTACGHLSQRDTWSPFTLSPKSDLKGQFSFQHDQFCVVKYGENG